MGKIDTKKKEQDEITVKYEDVMMVASGVLDDGAPASIGTIMIDKLSNFGEQVVDTQVTLDEVVLHFFLSGGCIVMQADFPRTKAFAFNRSVEALSEFMNNSGNPEYMSTHGFAVAVLPMVLYGQITVLLQDLVYFTGFDLPDMGKRLIMCFNDLSTEVLQNEDIDYDAISQAVEQSMKRESEKINDELNQVYAELEAEQARNPYQEMINQRLQQDAETVRNNDGKFDGEWMRSSQDE